MKKTGLRVVVDGSNLATEGRSVPSLVQLDEAVQAFQEEYKTLDVIVVVDASFEHRVAPGERARFKEAEAAGEIVTPPAGAVGRGDAFVLKIAQRISGVVLSNDSFQEFHEDYPWLFDAGRLIGGKPVRGVGWIFTERQPVRGTKVVRDKEVKKLAVALPGGATPTIGATLTPVKAARPPRGAKAAVPAEPVLSVVTQPTRPAKVAAKVAKKATGAKKADLAAKQTKPATVKKAAAPAKKAVVTSKASPKPPITSEPAVALRRGRAAVNPADVFALLVKQIKIGQTVTGEVTAFTSHGAVIRVVLKAGQTVECYAPTASLGTPPPARARDVLQRGDRLSFRLVTVDSERRVAELALV